MSDAPDAFKDKILNDIVEKVFKKHRNNIVHQMWAGDNVSFFPNKQCPEFFPQTRAELISLVSVLKSDNISFHVVSTGMNWGLGSKAITDEQVIINLSKLNRVIEINDTFGYAVIEPGVSQEQLSSELKSRGSKYFVDVTGSAKESSIVGNALERGVAYNSLREKSILQLEVLLADGTIFKTGFGIIEGLQDGVSELYPYGVGPNVMGLFFQSNFGVVTQVTIKLQKLMPSNLIVQIGFKSEDAICTSLDGFRALFEEKILDSVPRIVRRDNFTRTLLMNIEKPLQPSDRTKSILQYKKIIERIFSSEWQGVMCVSGDKEICNAKIRIIKKILGSSCRVRVFNIKYFKLIDVLLKFFPSIKFLQVLRLLREFTNLFFGKPSNLSLAAAVNRETYRGSSALLEAIDRQNVGFSYVLPIAPLCKHSGHILFKILHDLSFKHGITSSIILNILNGQAIEAVISTKYPKNDLGKVEEFKSALIDEYKRHGIYPYRLARYSSEYKKTYGDIKSLLRKLVENMSPES